MDNIQVPVEINKDDSFKTILSKFGCIALDRQENLSHLIGNLEGKLDLDTGILTFSDDIQFSIQILGFFTQDFNQWSWAWDNEDIGFREKLIESSKKIQEIGIHYNIPEFTTPVFKTTFDDCHLWAMTASGILDMDSYYAVHMDNLDIFVAIKSDLILRNDSAEKFRDTYYLFQKNFNIYPRLAFESYTWLKGYIFKEKEDFCVAKIGEDRVIAGFTERGNLTHIQMLNVD